jgi:hypothetical protein
MHQNDEGRHCNRQTNEEENQAGPSLVSCGYFYLLVTRLQDTVII